MIEKNLKLILFSLIFPLISFELKGEVLGRIEYPAQSIFSLEEGTIERWIKFEFDPGQTTEKQWLPKGAFFQFEIPEEKGDKGAIFSITVALRNVGKYSKTGSACSFRIGLSIEGKEVPYPVFVDCTDWQNFWHHIAVSWKNGKELYVYIDGKKTGEMKFPYSIIRDIPKKAKIIIGTPNPWYYPNLLVVDEIRISSIARNPDDLGFYKFPLLPDPYTLFLENFENIENNKTKPFIADILQKGNFEIKGGRITDGKIGKGFAFSK